MFIASIVLLSAVCTNIVVYAHRGLRHLSDVNEVHYSVWERAIEKIKFIGGQKYTSPNDSLPPHVLRQLIEALSADRSLIEKSEASVSRLLGGVDVELALLFAATRGEAQAIRSADVAPDIKAYLLNLTAAPLQLLPAVVSGLDVTTSVKIQSDRALAPIAKRRALLQTLLSRGVAIIWLVVNVLSGAILLGMLFTWSRLLKPPLVRLDEALGQLRRSERQLQTTLNSIGDAVIATDPDLKIIAMNPVAEALTGWPVAKALGVGLDEVVKLAVQMSDAEAPQPMSANRLADPDYQPVGSNLLTSRSGAIFRITESVAPLNLDGSDAHGVVVVLRDVTRQFELQRAVDRRIRLQAIGELASGVAHDFNNLLGVIMGNASLALRLEESKQATERLQSILKAARTGASLTEKLLLFAGSSPMPPRPQPIHDVLQSVITQARDLEGAAVQMSFICKRDLIADVDRGRLETALLHLMASALAAADAGGHIRLLAYEEVVNDTNVLTVCVEDDGDVPEAPRPQPLLDEYFPNRTVSRTRGLGIPMAAAFAEQAGGGLRVVSSVGGQRTTVIMHFPVAARLRATG